MEFRRTKIEGVVLIVPDVYKDDRGFFVETYHMRKYVQGGVQPAFVQDNHSRSTKGVLRGLHAQREHAQGKLVRAVEGAVFDVAVDVRRGSPTFGEWVGYELSSDNFQQLYVPPGCVHGFYVLSETAEVVYKCTDFYNPGDELGVIWNDADIGIEWPFDGEPILSEKDAKNPGLREVTDLLPEYEPPVQIEG